MALGVLVVLVLLIALGVHSCSVSATNSALQNYTSDVNSIMGQSQETSTQLFSELRSAGSASNATQLQNQVNQTLGLANSVLHRAQNLSVPDPVRAANSTLLLALRLRADGIADIASQIQPALSGSSGRSAVAAIAADTARFYASDVLYKDYAAPQIARAVNAAGVRFTPLASGQFLPSLTWLDPSQIAAQLHAGGGASKTSGPVSPGLHGHHLYSVSVNGTTLQTGSTNTLPASPPPTFTLSFANIGIHNESNVVCKVTVAGTNVSGQTTVPETIAGQNATCAVTLSSAPPTGTQSVTATIERVPGEKSVLHNSLTFPIDFQ